MRSKNPEYFKLIEDFVDEYKEEYGSSPSTCEIGEAVGLSKSAAANYLIYRIKKKYFISAQCVYEIACGITKPTNA